ncbi:MAG: C40 family peptidase [Bacteroidales bacterium]|nr:C40 family peptidase [Bacteroidales bacterium]
MKMNAGICLLSTIPVREKPSGKTEMINQLLFGDTVHILDSFESWFLIESHGDQYQGWVEKDQIKIISEDYLKNILDKEPVFLKNSSTDITFKDKKIILSQGSRIPFYDKGRFIINNNKGFISDESITISGKQPTEEILLSAKQLLSTPYLWGGRSAFGADCSGFVQIVFKMNGYQLPRDSIQQAKTGLNIDFIHEGLPGDLVFFENEEQQIVHVGILLNNHEIIHASGQVRIDSIDHEGIFNKQKQKYTHKLRLIKRIL